MKALMKTTKSAKPAEVEKKWHLIDADGLVVGRLATIVANILRGKHKPSFTPHVDCGDHVVIVNADKVRFTGRKLEQKIYYKHTGYTRRRARTRRRRAGGSRPGRRASTSRSPRRRTGPASRSSATNAVVAASRAQANPRQTAPRITVATLPDTDPEVVDPERGHLAGDQERHLADRLDVGRRARSGRRCRRSRTPAGRVAGGRPG